MPFEVFDKRQTALAKAPVVTIQRKGIISLNRAAYALMKEPAAVELLYDRDRKVVGLRPTDESTPHAYEVRVQTPSKDTGPLLVAGTAFTNFYDIDTSVSRRWTPFVEDGILCIDLSKPGAEIVANRASRGHEDVQEVAE
jgi:hypothetical protein